MNAYTATRSGPYWARAWTIGAIFVGVGALAVILDLTAGVVTAQLWWGLADLFLGIGLAALVLVVTGGHRPVAFRVGLGLLALFVAVFLVNLLWVALPGGQ